MCTVAPFILFSAQAGFFSGYYGWFFFHNIMGIGFFPTQCAAPHTLVGCGQELHMWFSAYSLCPCLSRGKYGGRHALQVGFGLFDWYHLVGGMAWGPFLHPGLGWFALDLILMVWFCGIIWYIYYSYDYMRHYILQVHSHSPQPLVGFLIHLVLCGSITFCYLFDICVQAFGYFGLILFVFMSLVWLLWYFDTMSHGDC